MKLRTSFFNPTVFKKNLTRFAPAWGLCSLYYLIEIFLTTVGDADNLYHNAEALILTTILINAAYAFLVAQLLFGDLYQSRLCNGLHCLPLRRECWFITNVASGLTFLLIPLAILCGYAGLAATDSVISAAAQVAPRLLLTGVLSYLCFFGLAVLATFCVGKRFAALLVYALLHFGAALIYGLLYMFYLPEHYGVVMQFDPFIRFCPIIQMASRDYMGGSVGYLWVYAGVGVAALVLSLMMYRHRQLEKAGDFIAVKVLEPVFLLIYTLAAALLFSLFWDVSTYKFFVYLGVAVGFFTGQMLLRRTTRVFGRKSLLGCGALMLALGMSFLVNRLDPLDIEHRIPRQETVQYAYLTSYSEYMIQNYDGDTAKVLRLEDEEDIANLLRLHALVLEEHDEENSDRHTTNYRTVRVTIGYDLTDGTRMLRTYNCAVDGDCAQLARGFLSRTECVLGISWEQAKQGSRYFIREITICDTEVTLTMEQMDELIAAIAADCAEGKTAENYNYYTDEEYYGSLWLMRDPVDSRYLEIYSSWTHTLDWMRENDLAQYFWGDEKYRET